MSYDIELVNENGETVAVPRHEEGGTYAAGGIERADLNITYNYAPRFHEAGITMIHRADGDGDCFVLDGSTGKESLVPLANSIAKLGIERDENYWKSTPGNAGYSLSILLIWAALYQNAMWKVT